jgi:parvulin-like peptidyl-prolyl isomerase
MRRVLFYFKGLIRLMAFIAIFLAACSPQSGEPTPTVTVAETGIPTVTVQPAGTPLPSTPTPTEEPLAARVNGQGITMAEYQAELAVYRAASGAEVSETEAQRVLEDLIDQTLLAQSAVEGGFSTDDVAVDAEIQALADSLGGDAPLAQWVEEHGYTQPTFRKALGRSMAAAWMRDQIVAATPKVVEQVHAREILLYRADDADAVYSQLQAGDDFGNLANQYDPVTGGDLGWFPRGYLLDKSLEEAAFNLQPGQYSQVIQTPAGFHILQVIERDAGRPLEPEALSILQSQAVQDWLEKRRADSDIEILVS